MNPGYTALRESAALLVLPGRGKILVYGEDRARLLHAMSTNHVEQLQTGQGCYAFFLNEKGRILADAYLFALETQILLDTEPETRNSLREHLDKFIIADDVTLEDVTDSYVTLAIEGPKAAETLVSQSIPTPLDANSLVPWEYGLVANVSSTGGQGFRLFIPSERFDELFLNLVKSGLPAATPDDALAVRLENGIPRYGADIAANHIPNETGRMAGAIHFSKGCYLGQEIVERVRSQGKVNRLLTPLRIDADEAPEPQTKIMAADKEAGVITSAALSPALKCVVALGYVRAEFTRAGAALTAAGRPVRIAER
jgi:folate-binding protein YgfZ